MKLAIVVGTRPEIIKMAPVVRVCGRMGVNFFILHTGQHYSPNMDRVFFEELNLSEPKYNLGIGNMPYNKQVGRMVIEMKKILEMEKPDAIVIQGDTTTVLAAALAASKSGIKIVHLEAGLRSHDVRMLEEINRIAADHISDYLFTPTERASANLLEEGYGKNNIYKVGNSIVDAVLEHRAIADKKSGILEKLGLLPNKYFLITVHRPENVDYKYKLEEFIRVLEMLKVKYPEYKIVLPLHPRTQKMISAFSLSLPANIKLIEPLAYLDFLKLQANARLVITDSGGVQEESCILKVPCVVARENTERPESVELGMSILAGLDTAQIDSAIKRLLLSDINWVNPYGDGTAAGQMINILIKELNNNKYV